MLCQKYSYSFVCSVLESAITSNPGVGCWAWYQTQCLDHVCYGFSLPDLNTWLATPEGGARYGAGHIVHLAGNPGVGCWAWLKTSALITNCNAEYLHL